MRSLDLELTEIADSGGGLRRRAGSFLSSLRQYVPFDAAWMAFADPRHPRYTTAADADVDGPVRAYLSGAVMAADIETTGTNHRQPPLSPSDLPYPSAELQTWSECLLPAGIHEALAVGLFEPGGRHVGFLALLYEGQGPPPDDARLRLARAAPVLGRGMDPVRSLTSAARLVRGATAGAILLSDQTVDVLPGLPIDPLLAAGSAVLDVAHAHVGAGHTCSSFLWPAPQGRSGHLRVTVIAATGLTPTMHVGVVLLSAPPQLHGLTPRELEVLGYVVDGCSNQEIAHHLVLAPRTVAAHLEHILAKLDASTRTLAAVRACREGMYVPVSTSLHVRGAAGPCSDIRTREPARL